jgi:hypothetical protein
MHDHDDDDHALADVLDVTAADSNLSYTIEVFMVDIV